MSRDWQQILTEHPDLDPELLKAYLEGRLAGEDLRQAERLISESAFVSDAIDGLAAIKDPSSLASIVADLNKGLHRRTRERRRKLFQGGIEFPGWLAFTTVILILLIIMAWLVLRIWQGK